MSNLEVVRAYELATAIIYATSFLWLWRVRSPLYLGALIGATCVFGFDWIYCGKDFFNATYNPDLIWIPGLDIRGVREPLAIPFAYGMAFGPFAVWLVMQQGFFDRVFGLWGYAIVWIIGAVGVMLYEIPVVHFLHIWTYHQAPGHLLWGVPWSDIWLAGNLIGVTYGCLRWMTRWANIPADAGFSLRNEDTWKGIVMGGLAPWAGFYVTFVIQLFWYSHAAPWVESGRPF